MVLTRALLAQPGFPTTRVTEQQKTDFLAAVMRTKHKHNIKQCVQDFSNLARGLGEYGSRTNPL